MEWTVHTSPFLYEPAREITVIVITNASNAGGGSHDIAQKLLTQARNVP